MKANGGRASSAAVRPLLRYWFIFITLPIDFNPRSSWWPTSETFTADCVDDSFPPAWKRENNSKLSYQHKKCPFALLAQFDPFTWQLLVFAWRDEMSEMPVISPRFRRRYVNDWLNTLVIQRWNNQLTSYGDSIWAELLLDIRYAVCYE
jgi:hypothetical protein